MGHRFELSKRHERKIKFELNSRVCGFHFLTRFSVRRFSIASLAAGYGYHPPPQGN